MQESSLKARAHVGRRHTATPKNGVWAKMTNCKSAFQAVVGGADQSRVIRQNEGVIRSQALCPGQWTSDTPAHTPSHRAARASNTQIHEPRLSGESNYHHAADSPHAQSAKHYPDT